MKDLFLSLTLRNFDSFRHKIITNLMLRTYKQERSLRGAVIMFGVHLATGTGISSRSFVETTQSNIQLLPTGVMSAVQRDNPELLAELLQKEDTYAQDDLSKALHYAANRGFDECIRLLLEAGALPDIHDSSGFTALILASKRGHAPVLSLLINAKCNVNKRSFRIRATALHWAATNGFADCVGLLIEAGAQLDLQTSSGRTPLMLAARAGHDDIVDKLVRAKCNMNAVDFERATPLHLASEEGNADCVRVLIRANAKPNEKRRNGATPLVMAAKKGHADVVRLLLRQTGVNIEQRTQEMSVLHWAAESGSAACVQLILDRGLDVNIFTKKSHCSGDFIVNSGVTPLMLACRRGHFDAVEILVNAGADVDVEDSDGYTGLLYAVKKDYSRCADMLLKAGADPNGVGFQTDLAVYEEEDYCCTNPLFLSVKENSLQSFKVLLRGDSSVNAIGLTRHGEAVTAFELALDLGRVRMCRMMVVAGFSISMLNFVALQEGMAKLLLKDEDTYTWVAETLRCPRPLMHQSRVCIRQNLNLHPISVAIDCLELPPPIKRFLNFSELEDVS